MVKGVGLAVGLILVIGGDGQGFFGHRYLHIVLVDAALIIGYGYSVACGASW